MARGESSSSSSEDEFEALAKRAVVDVASLGAVAANGARASSSRRGAAGTHDLISAKRDVGVMKKAGTMLDDVLEKSIKVVTVDSIDDEEDDDGEDHDHGNGSFGEVSIFSRAVQRSVSASLNDPLGFWGTASASTRPLASVDADRSKKRKKKKDRDKEGNEDKTHAKKEKKTKTRRKSTDDIEAMAALVAVDAMHIEQYAARQARAAASNIVPLVDGNGTPISSSTTTRTKEAPETTKRTAGAGGDKGQRNSLPVDTTTTAAMDNDDNDIERQKKKKKKKKKKEKTKTKTKTTENMKKKSKKKKHDNASSPSREDETAV